MAVTGELFQPKPPICVRSAAEFRWFKVNMPAVIVYLAAVVVVAVAAVVVAVVAAAVVVVAAAGLAACYCYGLRLCCASVNYTVSDVLGAFASNIYY